MSERDPHSELLYGQIRSRREPIVASAGPISFVFEDGMIKHIRLGDVELVRRVYFAVRTDTWDTIYPEFSNLSLEMSASMFRATFRADCERDEIQYRWEGEIISDAYGSIHFTAGGEALAEFGSNRIGLCLLLGDPAVAGRAFTLVKSDGNEEAGEFPRYVHPPLVASQFAGIRFQPAGGPTVQCDMTGAIFDMEDQRPYLDTTFKAYAPLPYAYPKAASGQSFEQTFSFRLLDDVGHPEINLFDEPVTIAIGKGRPEAKLDPVGLTMNAGGDDEPLSDRERAALLALRLDHLRLEYEPGEIELFDARLIEALRVIEPVDRSGIKTLKLSIRDAEAVDDGHLRDAVDRFRQAGLRRAMIELRDSRPEAIGLIRSMLEGVDLTCHVGGPGTGMLSDHHVIPDWAASSADFLSWSASAALHQEDDETLMENSTAIAYQLAAVAKRVHAASSGKSTKRLSMGPFSLGGVWPREYPDPRHTARFGAAWTSSALKHLVEGGSTHSTLFDAVGPTGVLYRPADFDQPGFDDTNRHRYPLCSVIGWFNELAGHIAETRSTDPLRVEALAIVSTDGDSQPDQILLINKTHSDQTVRFENLPASCTFQELRDQAEGRKVATWDIIADVDPDEGIVLPAYGLVRVHRA